MLAWIALAILLMPVQLFVTAPYGRHASRRWGPVIGNRLGWVIMEIVSPVALLAAFLWGGIPDTGVIWVCVALWIAHYMHRAIVFPLRIRTSGKHIPVAIVLSAVAFNSINSWANGFYLGSGWGGYPPGWGSDPRFIIGIAVFLAGAAINLWADGELIALRKHRESHYTIPHGGLFEKVSCPNHLGEIIEWCGFAIACWNLPALAFAVWTAANLIPRALSHHRWYAREFPDYPANRKALVPYVL